MIIYFIIYQEISYDRFHRNFSSIYQVMQYEKEGTRSSLRSEVSFKEADFLTKNIPEFEAFTIIPSIPAPALMINDQNINNAGIYSDAGIFKVFSFKLIKGKTDNVLASVNNIVISEALAAKYYPGQDPLGKVIKAQGVTQQFYIVTGIMKDIPVRSSLQFDYIIPFENFLSQNKFNDDILKGNLLRFYARLNSNSYPSVVNQKIMNIKNEPEIKRITENFLFPFSKRQILIL